MRSPHLKCSSELPPSRSQRYGSWWVLRRMPTSLPGAGIGIGDGLWLSLFCLERATPAWHGERPWHKLRIDCNYHLPGVKIRLVRCDSPPKQPAQAGKSRAYELKQGLCTVQVVIERCDELVRSEKVRNINLLCNSAIVIYSPFVKVSEGFIGLEKVTSSSNSSTSLCHETTDIRELQLNMMCSAVVTSEVRQLVAEKRLDILLLQEPYVRKQNASHTFDGLGTGMRVATVRSQRPMAMVAVCNPHLEMLYVAT